MAFNPKLPFRARDALAAGLTRRALASSRFRRLLPGVYVDARVPVTPLLEARAVMQLLPVDGFVSTTPPRACWVAWCPTTRTCTRACRPIATGPGSWACRSTARPGRR